MTSLDTAFGLLRQSAKDLLGQYNINVKVKGDWLNMAWCPWCGHGKDGQSNYQCGVHERAGENGFIHAVKCMHPHDSPTGEPSPHYADFLVALGALGSEDVAKLKSAKSTIQVASFFSQAQKVQLDIGRMNADNNVRGRRRLMDNVKAMEYLTKTRGYTQATIERFKLTLSEPYEKDGKQIHAHALAAPLIGADGNFYKKYVNYAIPDVTVDNRDKPQRAWSPGAARVYYNADARNKRWLFICDGLKDVWALHQLLEGSPLMNQLALVSSTNGGGGFPSDWRQPDYWNQFDLVFAGHDNDKADALSGRRAGDEHAKALAKLAEREIRRVTPSGVKDWNDWVLAGHTEVEFKKLLETAESIPIVEKVEDDDGRSFGRFAADPVSIVGEYRNGYLYEAVRTLVREMVESTGEVVEHYNTIVIRSDRTQHRAQQMPAPKGTPEHARVWRLIPDGTLLSRQPEPNPNLTWSWPSVRTWLSKKDHGTSLQGLMVKIQNHLRGSVWLPYEHDYAILSCAVVASYVQEVFDAVPLLLVTGPAGSGKSELGEAMRSMGANSRNVLARVSAATLARHIDATRGLVVIDDLEQIGVNNSGKDAQFDDLVQTLKLSYKKSTAMKMVTEFKNGQGFQREFNFFGIKVINNTRGSDSILGSRMLTINTRHMPTHVKVNKSLKLEPNVLDEIRNHLHTWAFNNVQAVAETYQAIFPNKTGRQDEIEAPLKVVAALSGDAALVTMLDNALARQKNVTTDPYSPEEILREALQAIVRRSMERDGVIPTWVTVTQVMYEMASLVDVNYGKDFTTSLAVTEKPEWVGRTLIQRYVDPDARQRTTLYGKGLRAYKLTDDFLASVLRKLSGESSAFSLELPKSENFKAFCKACDTCPYKMHCDMQLLRNKV
ncbi:toprim domain-containing protein [Giesbergeria anulus]|uniref:Uncharacterized protein n=1 Tax=Giesbergeria anulus TaxID=180197 RepID=A0A1H9SMG6_9BURK|nr:toprim domain-containing protein [Giesbergeria anulus]SER86078.1 hypothetical protein SAMN02982919_03172 [Giesbergeria anulus]